jgi:hypothetical protein
MAVEDGHGCAAAKHILFDAIGAGNADPANDHNPAEDGQTTSDGHDMAAV